MKTVKLPIVALFVLLTLPLHAQRMNNAYTFSTGVDSTLWIDIDSLADTLVAAGGYRSPLTDIGFPFHYGESVYSQFSVNRYGTLRFGGSLAQSYYTLLPFNTSEASYVYPAILVMNSNNTMDDSSFVRYALLGEAGERVLVVEWFVAVYSGSTLSGRLHYQAQLYEGSNAVRLVYAPRQGNAPTSPYQIGFIPQEGDVAFLSVATHTLHYGSSFTLTNGRSLWPEDWRWYAIDFDNDFCHLHHTPWSEDFNSLDSLGCWTRLDYDASSYTQWYRERRTGNDYCMWAYFDNAACNDWLVSPPIQLPDDSGGLMLMYDFRATGPDGDCGEMEVRIAPYGTGEVPAVDTLDFDPAIRLDGIRATQGFESRGVRLGDYAGQKIRIAFVHVSLHNNSNIYIDNVRVEETTAPRVRLEAPSRAHAHDTVVVSAFLDEGSRVNADYEWSSTMGDLGLAVLYADSATLNIVYLESGYDTITCVADNGLGRDTVRVETDVVDCTTVHRYPWKEDFEHDLDCWYQLGGWSVAHSLRSFDGGDYLRSNSSQYGPDEGSFWIISQPFALPDTITMMELMWWMRTPSEYASNQNQFSLRVAVVDSTEMPSEDSFTTVMSRTMYYGDWEHYRFPLDAYAGQTVRFMFYNNPSNSGYGYFDCVLIDQMEVRSTREPKVKLEAPLRSDHLDSVRYVARLEEGDTAGLTYTWFSALLDSTFLGGDTAWITYPASGVDTLTVVADNIWGADTVSVVVKIENCPPYYATFSEDFEGGGALECWTEFAVEDREDGATEEEGLHRICDTSLWYIGGDAGNHYLEAHARDQWIVTPAIQLPEDTSDLRLSWNQLAGYLCINIGTSDSYFEAYDFPTRALWLGHDEGVQHYSLAAFAGQCIRIAFWTPYSLAKVDDIRVEMNGTPPAATLTAPSTVGIFQDVTVTATLNDCSRQGLTQVWHSSLLGVRDSNSSTFSLTYTSGGIDTITYIVSNAVGSDTQQVVIMVLDCNGLAVPYSENFDNTEGTRYDVEGQLPTCWTAIWRGSMASRAPHVLQAGSSPFFSSSSNGLFMLADAASDSVAYAVLPAFDVPLEGLSLSFDHWHESVRQGTLWVGYMTGTDFTPMASLPPEEYDGRRDTVFFAGVPPTATHMAFEWRCPNSLWYSVLIDNVEVSEAGHTGIRTTSQVPLEVYPNPASGEVTVGIGQSATVELMDMNGRVRGEWEAANGKQVIDAGRYPAGVYYVRVTTDGGVAVKRLIVR